MNEFERQLADVLRAKAAAVGIRPDLDDLKERRRLGATGASGAPTPSAGSESPPTPRVALGLLVAAVVIIVGAGYTIATRGDSPPISTTAIADCPELVLFESRLYERDLFNDDAMTIEQLGPRLGEVTERLVGCGELERGEMPSPDSFEGVAGLLVPIGTEIKAVPGEEDRSLIAAVVPAGVWFFRALDSDPLDFDGEVDAIGINDDDGTTRLATITDPSLVSALVEDARSAPPSEYTGVGFAGPVYFIAIERTDGITVTLQYRVPERQFHLLTSVGFRSVSDTWAAAIDAALG